MHTRTSITHAELVHRLSKPGTAIIQGLTPVSAHALHMALGLSGEASELMDVVITSLMTDYPLDRTNALEELGDMEFYLEGLHQSLGMDRLDTTPVHVGEIKPSTNLLRTAAVLCVNSGLALDTVKKFAIYGGVLDRGRLFDAVRATKVGMHCFRRLTGITVEETIAYNIAKLSKRYQSLEYSDKAAQLRADKQPEELPLQ